MFVNVKIYTQMNTNTHTHSLSNITVATILVILYYIIYIIYILKNNVNIPTCIAKPFRYNLIRAVWFLKLITYFKWNRIQSRDREHSPYTNRYNIYAIISLNPAPNIHSIPCTVLNIYVNTYKYVICFDCFM